MIIPQTYLVSPYDDPHVTPGEIADYLDHLRLEATPPLQPDAPPTATACSA
jgi:hypothetical protein